MCMYVFTLFLVDGDGWLSLFQLVGGNRDFNHPTITQKPTSPWNRSFYRRRLRIKTKSTETRPETIANFTIRYRRGRRCTLVKYAAKLWATGGTTRPSTGRRRTCVRCASRRSRDVITWKRTLDLNTVLWWLMFWVNRKWREISVLCEFFCDVEYSRDWYDIKRWFIHIRLCYFFMQIRLKIITNTQYQFPLRCWYFCSKILCRDTNSINSRYTRTSWNKIVKMINVSTVGS